MGQSIGEEKILTLETDGKGNTKDQAIGEAFSKIQKMVEGIAIRIEPLTVEVVDATQDEYTERFLFLFFKRTRSEYYIKLKVTVRVLKINVEGIKFESKKNNSMLKR